MSGGTIALQLRPGLAGVAHFLCDPVAQSFSCDARAFIMENKSAKILVSDCEAVESATQSNAVRQQRAAAVTQYENTKFNT